MLSAIRATIDRFLQVRGTQLAAMIAYYALLSFVPLVFMALGVLALVGEVDAESALVQRVGELFPGAPTDQIVSSVNALQGSAGTIGLIGLAVLVWSALGLFGALQSGFNIVFGLPNPPFIHGKGIAAGALTVLLATLLVGLITLSVVTGLITELVPRIATKGVIEAITLLTGLAATFLLLTLAFQRMTNERLRFRDVFAGALLAAIALQVTFQVVPLFIRLTSGSLVVQIFGSTAVLLIWFYVMGVIVIFCHTINWWLVHGRAER